MSAGQTLPLLRHAGLRTRPCLRFLQTGQLNGRQFKRHLTSSSSPTASTSSKRIQIGQAVLLGSLATVAVQGALLYSNAPSPASDSTLTSTSDHAPQAAVRNLENALEAIHKAGVETSIVEDVLQGYATAPGTSYPPSLPLAIAYPSSTEDVVEIVNACRDSNVRKSRRPGYIHCFTSAHTIFDAAIIPISGRTSLEGQTLAVTKKGSAILVCLDKMNNIIEVNEMNGDAVVQAVSHAQSPF